MNDFSLDGMKDIYSSPFSQVRSKVDILTEKIYKEFEHQRLAGCNDRRAIYRAVHDCLMNSFQVLEVQNHLDRNVPDKILEKDDYKRHIAESTFYKFVGHLHENKKCFTHEEAETPYGNVHRYSITVFVP